MGQEQLYLLDTLVKKILLRKQNAVKILEDFVINVKFNHIVNYDIDFKSFTPQEALTLDSGDQKIVPNTGRSYLFVSRPSILRQLLEVDPIQIHLLEGVNPIAGVDVKLQKEYGEMIKLFESIGIVKSCTQEEAYELFDESKKPIGSILVQLKMSCFGRNIQTAYQLKKEKDKKFQCLFKQRNTSKTFFVERIWDGPLADPMIGPIYSGWQPVRDQSEVDLQENASLTELFERQTIGTKISTYNAPAGNFEDFDVVSMCYRPQENKFFDFLNLISMDVQTHDRGTTLQIQRKKLEKAQDLLKTIEGTVSFPHNQPLEEDEDDLGMLTSEKIERKLCGNKDCPAVKKFKEYGIGPLATGKGLGTLYNDVEPPVVYGMSHTYGTMHDYGPFGVFARPKHEELPFVPPKNEFDAEMQNEQPKKRLCTYCQSIGDNSKKKKKKHHKEKSLIEQCPKHGACQEIRLRGGGERCCACVQKRGGQDYVLRLRGGASYDEETENEFPEQSTSNVPDDIVMPKSPMLECKPVMDKFDDILNAYRKALGPCGQAICPYAQTMAEETCKKTCPARASTNKDDEKSCDDVPCGTPACPYTPDRKTNVVSPGCGSPRCAYAQYKLGLVDDDAELELKCLPPAVTTNCGDRRCKFPASQELPPIHWDCPDPLPKGKCKNPNCPFLPPPLRKFKTKELKIGPCGSPICPYALPQPCGQPTCPFVPQPCPMPPTIQECEPVDAKGAKYKGSFEDVCPNGDCSGEKKKKRKHRERRESTKQSCDNPSCPFYVPTSCDNPACPLNEPKRSCPPNNDENSLKDSSKQSICSNPDCLFNANKEETSSSCDNPNCPFAKKPKKKKPKRKSKDIDSICSNPDCPQAQRKKKDTDSICSNPDCPSSQARRESCPQETSKSRKSDSNKADTCDNPNCPFSIAEENVVSNGNNENGNVQCTIAEDDSICSNPNCPEAKGGKQIDSDCSNPDCPFSKSKKQRSSEEVCKDPLCPYGMPLPTRCGMPQCPYDLLQKNQETENRRRVSERNQEGDNIEIVGVQNEIECGDNVDTCDNPDCAYYEKELGKMMSNKKIKKKHGKRKKKGKFVYTMGDDYPGVKVGHKECVHPVFHVPPNMGWLWNVWTPILRMKPRRNWRPGAIPKQLAAIIRAHRRSKGLGMLHLPQFKKGGGAIDVEEIKVVPKPTLHIQKKEGAYWITMNPLKDPKSLVENEDPYMDCTPMTFKITKNKKIEEGCFCNEEDQPLSDASSDSELDIEFTPPAGIIHPERFKKKPNTVCAPAQYDANDLTVPKSDKKGDKGKKKGGKKGKGDKKKGGKEAKGGKKKKK